MWQNNRQAFTLIELLIVVAIIGILAAIAIPNFLQAQVRAKVARTHAEFHSIATGMEAYAVDQNGYPPIAGIQSVLTSPVRYMTRIDMTDPFAIASHGDDPSLKLYGYSNNRDPLFVGLANAFLSDPAKVQKLIEHEWVFLGRGPDSALLSQSDPQDTAVTAIGQFPILLANGHGVYDPTNGTISFGDIIRTTRGVITTAGCHAFAALGKV